MDPGVKVASWLTDSMATDSADNSRICMASFCASRYSDSSDRSAMISSSISTS